jgi:glycosyltransferase involved in cell wall biosynthesis
VTDPLVSVIMTAFNRERFIIESIESVLASTYKNFELIIVDDGFTDETVNIAREYEVKDSRIKVYVNEKNLGDYPNRNRAASYAQGKYLKYVDSDDKLYPGGLKYCVDSLETNPGADWGIIFPEEIAEEYVLDSNEAIQAHFFEKPFLKAGPGQTILKKDFFIKVGMYPVLYGPANDMYFNLLAASKGKVLVLKDNFLFYRRHDAQEQSNRFSYLYNNCKYLKDALENLDLPLNNKQINWLQKKRKRRFSVNLVNYFLETRNLLQIKQACHKAGFSFKDFLVGIFHFNAHP